MQTQYLDFDLEIGAGLERTYPSRCSIRQRARHAACCASRLMRRGLLPI
jgi:hypothetical protein